MDDDGLDALMCRVRAGEDTAFDALVRELHWPLRLWLAARSEPAIDADEIAHAAFIHAFHHRQEYQPGSSVRAWLWTIARFRLLGARTELRRRARREQVLSPQLTASLAQALEESPQADAEELAALGECLRHLGEQPRALLDGYYRDERPLPELASLLGASLGALRKRLCLIRRDLRECIRRNLARRQADV